MPKGGRKKFNWTPKRLAFVMAWKGSDVDAAREAGFLHPDGDAFKLMQLPEIRDAVEKKRKQMIDLSASKIATKASKVDVVERALKLADMLPEKTNNNITGQVAALRLIAEMQGHLVKGQEHEQFRKQLEGKSEEEKAFFAEKGYWPDAVPLGKPN